MNRRAFLAALLAEPVAAGAKPAPAQAPFRLTIQALDAHKRVFSFSREALMRYPRIVCGSNVRITVYGAPACGGGSGQIK